MISNGIRRNIVVKLIMFKSLFRRKTNFISEEHHSLNKVLTVRDLTLFGIAAIIGGGIFSSVGKACAEGGPGVIFLFIICAIACGFAALCYAEFSSRIPVSGSAYTYAYASFGELFAWIIGWALLMEYSIGNIYIAFSWSGYFTHLLDAMNFHLPRWMIIDYKTASAFALNHANLVNHQFSDLKEIAMFGKSHGLSTDEVSALQAWVSAPRLSSLKIIFDAPALLINILITMLVYRGIQESRNTSNAMVLLKIAIIVLIIFVGVFYIDLENYTPFVPNGFKGIMGGVSAVFFTYIGFDAVSTLAEESKNPKRDLPRGMFYSLIICSVLYILISLVLTGMAPYHLLGVDDPLAFVLGYKNIKWLEYVVSVSAVVAMASVLLVFQMGQPRIWMSMSRDGLLPKSFSKIHPKHKTPGFSTIVTGFVVGVPILFTDENFVLDFTSIGTILAFILVCGGVLLLPKRDGVQSGTFSLKYINAQFIFPLLLIISAGIIYFNIEGYFTELVDFKFDTMFHFSHRIMWIFFVFLAIFTYIKKWSLIPILGLTTCSYLLTGMKKENWIWFGGWFVIGLILYFAYGYRKSNLAIKHGR